MIQVRFAGLGGQGIILMGEILGEAAVMEKKYVGQTSSYGAEARGSACQSDVIISDSWIDYPEITEADILACMSQGTYDHNKAKINPSQGVIFIDSQLIKPDASLSLKHIPVPATERALKEFENRLVANMILLGTVVKAVGLVGEESLLQALSNRVPPSLLELDKKALLWGGHWVKGSGISP
jgi:2-oxoglutarate ferredoxin oxidoreductase subunit gamma